MLQIDHDVCSNYGNWLYSAGIGNDPREDRKFNMVKQGLDYDPEVQLNISYFNIQTSFVINFQSDKREKMMQTQIKLLWKEQFD